MTRTYYRQLTYDQRCQISAYLKSKMSCRDIARHLKVHRSTIYREIERNSGLRGYLHRQAHQLSCSRKAKKPSKLTRSVKNILNCKLYEQWSPEQISGWMRQNCSVFLSHERIYQYIWQDKQNGGMLYKNLRHSGKKYNKRSGTKSGRGCIPNRIDIDERPEIVEKKQRVGDWELDTIIGKQHQGAIVSMVDRASKFTKLSLVKAKEAALVGDAIIDCLQELKGKVFTLTADNGKEFSGHQSIAKRLNAKVFFAKPYHSWQRGLNEHTNGLVRQYFPKGTSFANISEMELHKVEKKLNTRPRKCLNFKTPEQVFAKMTA